MKKIFILIIKIILFISAESTIVLPEYDNDPYYFDEYEGIDRKLFLTNYSSVNLKCSNTLKTDLCFLETRAQSGNDDILNVYFGSCPETENCIDSHFCRKNINPEKVYLKKGDSCFFNEECETRYCFKGTCSYGDNCPTGEDTACEGYKFCYKKNFTCLSYKTEYDECNEDDKLCGLGLVCQKVSLDPDYNYLKYIEGTCIREMSLGLGEYVSNRKACETRTTTKFEYGNYSNLSLYANEEQRDSRPKGKVCATPNFAPEISCQDNGDGTLTPCFYYVEHNEAGMKEKSYFKFSDCLRIGTSGICPPRLGDVSEDWKAFAEIYKEKIVNMEHKSKVQNIKKINYGVTEYKKKFLAWRYRHIFTIIGDEEKHCFQNYLNDLAKDTTVDFSYLIKMPIFLIVIINLFLF